MKITQRILQAIAWAILLIGIYHVGSAQEGITINCYIDGKLLVIGDSHQDNKSKLDVAIQVDLQGNQYDVGYLFVYPKFEYADLLESAYLRYSGGVGFSFYLGKNFELAPSLNYGRVIRYDRAFSSFEGCLSLNYRLGSRWKVSLLGTLTQRNDIKYRWGTNVIRESGYIGLIYKIK